MQENEKAFVDKWIDREEIELIIKELINQAILGIKAEESFPMPMTYDISFRLPLRDKNFQSQIELIKNLYEILFFIHQLNVNFLKVKGIEEKSL